MSDNLLEAMETSVPIRLRYHHIWSGDGKGGKSKTGTLLKKKLAEKGITLFHLDLDLERGLDHYPDAKNIKIGSLDTLYKFQKNAYTMYKNGQLENAVLMIDPLNPIFDWIGEDITKIYGTDNFISDKRVKFEGKDLSALNAFYMKCKEFILDIERWFPFIISVIHLKKSELGSESDKVLYDSFQLYGQMRQWMHHKTCGSMMFSSTRSIDGIHTTHINKVPAHILSSNGMREDPEFASVKTGDDLVEYYAEFLPKQFKYLADERAKLNSKQE